jgi:chitin deacetylase
VLSILEKYQIPATFFVIGQEIEQHPESLKNIIASGHQVGNHSYTHQRMVLKSAHRVRYEIEKTDTLIINA